MRTRKARVTVSNVAKSFPTVQSPRLFDRVRVRGFDSVFFEVSIDEEAEEVNLIGVSHTSRLSECDSAFGADTECGVAEKVIGAVIRRTS